MGRRLQRLLHKTGPPWEPRAGAASAERPPRGSEACIHHPGVGGAAQSHQSICQKTWSSAKGATSGTVCVRDCAAKNNFTNVALQLSRGKPLQRCNGRATRLQPLARERRAVTVCLDDPPRPLELVELKHSQPHLRRCVTRLPWFLLTCWRRPHELQSQKKSVSSVLQFPLSSTVGTASCRCSGALSSLWLFIQ